MMKYGCLPILVLCLLVLCEASLRSQQLEKLSKPSDWRFTNCSENRGSLCVCPKKACGCVTIRQEDLSPRRRATSFSYFMFSDCNEFPQSDPSYIDKRCGCQGNCHCATL
ncbi:unnamed protein product [Owenia fusiformis]|uniref:Uncharacterized protein n=1 Tax=Owenia fusiformis TaxID=6347 RepID=A0A8J1XX42_OWEFU|nr:unnamed protein product [Owenia fusiformis]